MQLLCFYAEPAEIADISGYGARLGQALAQAIRDNLTQDKLPPVPAADGQGGQSRTDSDNLGQSRTASDGSGAAYGRLYYNIAHSILDPTLRENYRLVNAAAETVQLALDELMNVHLKVQHADFPKERADTIIGAASVEDIPWAETLRRMTSPVENISQSFADDFIQANAEFRYNAGFDTYVERTGGSGCCAWCAELSGKFNYPDDIPENVFARHDNCTCSVEYKTGGMHHDPHTNLKLTLPKSPPLRLDDSMQAAAIANSNRVLENKYGAGLTSAVGIQGAYYIKGIEEFEFTYEVNTKKVVKDLFEQYKAEYENFTSIFGELTKLAGITVSPYMNDKVYGDYNPYSREIILPGIGGKDGFAFMSQAARNEKKIGQWSTASPFHAFRHELGHALQTELQGEGDLWKSKFSEIQKIYDDLKSELTNLDESGKIEYKIKKLSRYGFDDIGEFISECVAEYVNNPKKARKTAKSVVEIILRKAD